MTPQYTEPRRLREDARAGRLKDQTSGQAPGFLQANMMIVPKEDAFDFLLFCQRNPKPCPLIEVLSPGAVEPLCITHAPGKMFVTDLRG